MPAAGGEHHPLPRAHAATDDEHLVRRLPLLADLLLRGKRLRDESARDRRDEWQPLTLVRRTKKGDLEDPKRVAVRGDVAPQCRRHAVDEGLEEL